jgi:hypothetical protein
MQSSPRATLAIFPHPEMLIYLREVRAPTLAATREKFKSLSFKTSRFLQPETRLMCAH